MRTHLTGSVDRVWAIGLAALVALILIAGRANAAWYYVATDGDSENDGGISNPWDLASALTAADGASVISPGDTIWLRAGTYGAGGSAVFSCTLRGTEAKPIIIRNYPGERAIINAGVLSDSSSAWLVLTGLEITNTSTSRGSSRAHGLQMSARGARIINCVFHDTGHPAIGFWGPVGDGGELYGNIVWGAGYYQDGTGLEFGSATYMQNVVEGTKRYVTDNITFRNFTNGQKVWAIGGPSHGFQLEGNVTFDNPLWNALEHSNSEPGKDNNFISNYTWACDTDASQNVQWGYQSDPEYSARIEDNYLVGGNTTNGVLMVELFKDLVVTGNTLVGAGSARLAEYQRDDAPIRAVWNKNSYYKGSATQPFQVDGNSYDTWTTWRPRTGFDSESTYNSAAYPSGIKTFVRPNIYEPGRGHVIVYNWDEEDDVDVDLSSILEVGDSYEIRDAQNYFGTLAGSGTYSGGTVSFPMDLTTVAQPVGTCSHVQWRYDRHTMPQFGVFVVQRTSASLPRVYLEVADDGGESGTDPITFRVRRTGSLDEAITVGYSIIGGSAVGGTDYSMPTGSVEIAADDDSATFSISVTDDSYVEDEEFVRVTLSPDSSYDVDPVQATAAGAIIDDDGSAAHWKLDEGQGLYTCDSTGNKPDASAQWATWTTGKFGNAMSFNGTNQRVQTSPVNLCNISTYTVSAWFKTTDTSGTNRDIYSECYPSNDYFRLYTVSGTVYFKHSTNSGGVVVAQGSYAAGANDGEWHHVAVVRSGAQAFAMYIDGTLRASDTTNSPGQVSRTYSNTYIGMYNNVGTPETTYFSGSIDDVRVYDQALSAAEIGQLYSAPTVSITASDPVAHEFSGKTGQFTVTRTGSTTSALTVNLGISGTATNGTDYSAISSTVTIPSGYVSADITVTPTNDTSAEDDETVVIGVAESTDYIADEDAISATVTIDDDDTGLLVHWKMDEGSGSYTSDATGNKSDGTVWASWTTGQYGNALSFNGSNQRVDVSPVNTGALDTFTLSAWFKTSTTTGDRRDIYSERYAIWGYTRLMINDGASGRLTFEHRDNSSVTASIDYDGGVCDDEWHHAAGVRRSDSQFDLYVDGVLVGSDTDHSPASWTANAAWIATYSAPGGELSNFIGRVDDVRIYNRALTDKEVALLYDSVHSVVSVSALEDDRADESGDTAAFIVSRESESLAAALQVNYSISGTAVNGSDYSTLSGSVTIAAGDDSATVMITPIDDVCSESDETVTLTLSAGDYAIGEDAGSDTVTITDNEPVLLSHWKLDETSGYVGDDSAGSRDLTVYGDWVTGIIGNALYLDGVSGDRAYVGSPTGIGNMDRYTVSAWFKTDNTGTTARDVFSESYSVTDRVRLCVNSGTAGLLSFQQLDFGGDGPSIDYSGSVNDDSWHHVAVVRKDRSSFDLYLDGSLVGSETEATPGWTKSDKIGVGFYNNPEGTTYFDGSVDDVRVYSGALSAFEVSLLAMDSTNTVLVDATDDSASETGPGTGTFTVSRTGSTSGDLRVSYTLSGTAENGDDYTTLQGAVVIPSGQSSATVTVTPVDDADTESSETVILTLAEGVYDIDGSNSSDTVTISDND